MFRKVFTTVILMFAAVMVFAQANDLKPWGNWIKVSDPNLPKVDHSSQDKVIEAYWEAMASRNGALLWSLVPPKYQKHPNAAAIKKGYINGAFQTFPIELSKELRTAMKNPAVLKKLVENGKKEFQANMVQIDGKWYMDFIGKTIESLASAKIPPKPAAVDHSSKTKVLFSFMLGLYYEDDDLVWNALDPNLRVDEKGKKGIAKHKKVCYNTL